MKSIIKIGVLALFGMASCSPEKMPEAATQYVNIEFNFADQAIRVNGGEWEPNGYADFEFRVHAGGIDDHIQVLSKGGQKIKSMTATNYDHGYKVEIVSDYEARFYSGYILTYMLYNSSDVLKLTLITQ